jgi:uncharacterized protein (TIGR03435 family)
MDFWYGPSFLDRPVINQTGLQGNYDFDLAFTDEPPAGTLGQAAPWTNPARACLTLYRISWA